MTAVAPTLAETFGGIPLIDNTFDSGRFLTAVASTRLYRAGRADELVAAAAEDRALLLEDALDPERALAFRDLRPFPGDVYLLSEERAREASGALTELAALVPRWNILNELSINFLGLRRPGVIGSSNFAFPQHIFLAEEAFASQTELLEQVLHEVSHNWLYLVEEMWPLHRTTGDVVFELPSGTSNRNPGEVLGASHVTRNLQALYHALPQTPETRQRLKDLEQYMNGCIELLGHTEAHLTAFGREVANRLLSEDIPASSSRA
ncbi:HEXXH motif-containing putative peptide modification protein [Streptomyces virginiae]|uniref:aKG-HExxH-type peptide beta-hydroxylase n=1 Tax=Streptomyces virginiae TaxID=1961 RepID=UPI0036CBA7C2